jgi:hypothetical protein
VTVSRVLVYGLKARERDAKRDRIAIEERIQDVLEAVRHQNHTISALYTLPRDDAAEEILYNEEVLWFIAEGLNTSSHLK